VIFRSLNLIQEDFPLRSKFHVIFCRNVMIYFDQPTKLNLIRQFYELTEPGGYLMIGHTETIQRNETRWQYVQPAIYRKQK
jgi:chemotaxis protein methyltransferase CheR